MEPTASIGPARHQGRMPTFVIVGASLAGAKAAETLRDEGFDGQIVLLGTEQELPYARPDLSKGYLLGRVELDSVYVHPADWYAEHDVDLRMGVTVTAIDRAAATLNSGPAAARSMLRQPVVYDPVPYFYTDQYDLSMECAGLPSPGTYDQVAYRGDRASRKFIAFWLSGGKVIAGMNVNIWDVNDDIQSLIRSRRQVDLSRLTNPDIPIPEV